MASDTGMVRSAGAGTRSFEAFYRSQRKSLIALAYAVTGSRRGAEDLAQDALVAAFKSWDQIRVKGNPGTWVRRILLNKAASVHRRRLAEVRALARHPVEREAIPFPDVTDEVDRIWSEVRRLSRRQMQVIALAYVEQLTPTEIAAVLMVSKQTVDVHMRRARATLSRRLELEDI